MDFEQSFFDELEKLANYMCGSDAKKKKKPMKKMALLKGKQHKIDANKNGRIDSDDLAALRASKDQGGKTALASHRWTREAAPLARRLHGGNGPDHKQPPPMKLHPLVKRLPKAPIREDIPSGVEVHDKPGMRKKANLMRGYGPGAGPAPINRMPRLAPARAGTPTSPGITRGAPGGMP